MKIIKPLAAYFFLAGALQVGLGLLALAWALPLFADPPFLGQGLVYEHFQLQKLLAGNDSATPLLSALRDKLRWLFQRQSEGVLVGLGMGGVMVAFGLLSCTLGASAWAGLRRDESPRRVQ